MEKKATFPEPSRAPEQHDLVQFRSATGAHSNVPARTQCRINVCVKTDDTFVVREVHSQRCPCLIFEALSPPVCRMERSVVDVLRAKCEVPLCPYILGRGREPLPAEKEDACTVDPIHHWYVPDFEWITV